MSVKWPRHLCTSARCERSKAERDAKRQTPLQQRSFAMHQRPTVFNTEAYRHILTTNDSSKPAV